MSYAKVINGVYIGDCESSADIDLLRDVNCILDVTSEPIPTHIYEERLEICELNEIEIIEYPLEDTYLYSLDEFDQYINHIRNLATIVHKKSPRGILVHCWAGINRSALVIAGYLIIYHNMSAEDAEIKLCAVNATRDMPALCNESFCRLLKMLED